MENMKKTLIIGYGNPLRSDDSLGWHIAELLQETYNLEDLEFITEHQLTPELSESMSHFDQVILIDASVEGIPGEVRKEMIRPSDDMTAAFTHHVDPQTLLTMTKQLYGTQPEAVLFTICGADFGHGEELSPAVQAAVPALLQQIHSILTQ